MDQVNPFMHNVENSLRIILKYTLKIQIAKF